MLAFNANPEEPLEGQEDNNYNEVVYDGAKKNYVSYADKAKEQGKQIIDLNAEIDSYSDISSATMNDDGTLLLYVSGDFNYEMKGERIFTMTLLDST